MLALQDRLRFSAPRRRRTEVTSYRFFVSIMFLFVAAVDAWSDRALPPTWSANVVGPLSLVVWSLTLLGAFGIGPVRKVWDAWRG